MVMRTYDEINKVDAYSSQKDSKEGYISEIYLYYPKKLNVLHNEFYQVIEIMLPNSCKNNNNNNKTMQYFKW